jgi:hypothetical protein
VAAAAAAAAAFLRPVDFSIGATEDNWQNDGGERSTEPGRHLVPQNGPLTPIFFSIEAYFKAEN